MDRVETAKYGHSMGCYKKDIPSYSNIPKTNDLRKI